MTTTAMRERISEDGLRYKKKASNSDPKGFTKSTRSCLVCAKHHPQSEGLIFSLMGRYEYFCSQECKDKIVKSKVL